MKTSKTISFVEVGSVLFTSYMIVLVLLVILFK